MLFKRLSYIGWSTLMYSLANIRFYPWKGSGADRYCFLIVSLILSPQRYGHSVRQKSVQSKSHCINRAVPSEPLNQVIHLALAHMVSFVEHRHDISHLVPSLVHAFVVLIKCQILSLFFYTFVPPIIYFAYKNPYRGVKGIGPQLSPVWVRC